MYRIIAQGGPNDSDETYRTVGSATGAEPGIDARANVAVIDIAEIAPIESGCPGVAIDGVVDAKDGRSGGSDIDRPRRQRQTHYQADGCG